MTTDFTNDPIDFTEMLNVAKEASRARMAELGIKDDLSNAVTSGTTGYGYVIENENDCPLYLERVTAGWWFVRHRGSDELDIVKVAPSGYEGLHVLQAGDDRAFTVQNEVAQGMRFLARFDIPKGI